VYGAIFDLGEGNNGKLAMTFLMYSAILPVIIFSIAVFLIFKNDILDFKGQELKKQKEQREASKES
jgi:hypothetical protein